MKSDYQTSTVDGAAGFAKINTEYIKPDFDSDIEVEDEEEPWETEECNCSDPGCPCGGSKRMYW